MADRSSQREYSIDYVRQAQHLQRLHNSIPNTARLAADLRMWGGGMMWVRGAADVFESVGGRGQVLCLWGGCGCEGLSIMGEHGIRHVMKGL